MTLPLVFVVAAALIRNSDEILLAQRPAHKNMGGLWEFAGGKIESGETPEAALARELAEELGIVTEPARFIPLTFVSYSYEKFHLLMLLYAVREWEGTPQTHEHQALAWVSAADLAQYPMPDADIPLIPVLQKFLAG